jgi:hypothetical protein
MYVPRNPYFSEFSYGFAVTENLVTNPASRISVAPVFPSLIEENQVGFDVMLQRPGKPLFLQFKLAHQMTARAFEVKAGHFGAPFFRMYLRCNRESNQHANLLALEASGEEVLYVAPKFHTVEQLNEAYQLRRVWERSLQLAPSAIGALDQASHHIGFTDLGDWQVFSEEPHLRGKAKPAQEVIKSWEISVQELSRQPLRATLARVDAHVMTVLKERQVFEKAWAQVDITPIERDLSPLQRVAYFARHFFDLQLFVATERQR